MINGFEDFTHELTDIEEIYVPYVCEILEAHEGKDKAITNIEIERKLSQITGNMAGAARIRKIINHIRRAGLIPCLLSNSKGYFISDNEQEVLDYIASLIQRSDAIRQVAVSLKKQLRDNSMKVVSLFP